VQLPELRSGSQNELPPGMRKVANAELGLLRECDVVSFQEMLGTIAEGRAVLFVGAGPSVPFYGTGQDLASHLCDEARLVRQNETLFTVADKCRAKLGSRRYSEILIQKFGDRHQDVHQSVHLLMARAPFDAYVTTNYDPCIEEAFVVQGLQHGLVHSYPDVFGAADLGNKSVFHIHGLIKDAGQDPNSLQVVLAEAEYREAYDPDDGYLSTFLEEVMIKSTRTVIFCGYSFKEPSCVLESLDRGSARLERLLKKYTEGIEKPAQSCKRKHYVLLSVPSFPDLTYWEETAADVDRLLEMPRTACRPVVDLISVLYANPNPSDLERGHEHLRRLLQACADVQLVAKRSV